MAYSLKTEISKPERFTGGHRLCAGCGAAVAVRGVLRALEPEDRAVVINATGCLEVSSFLYPYTAWKDSYIHSAFENAGATAGGVEAAFKALKRRGKLEGEYKFHRFRRRRAEHMTSVSSPFPARWSAGTTWFTSVTTTKRISNTGIQRSSATPRFADATTTPVGKESSGKRQNKKELTEIIAAHNIPYIAQTTFIGNFRDLHEKAPKSHLYPRPRISQL